MQLKGGRLLGSQCQAVAITAGKSPDTYNQKTAQMHAAVQLRAPFIQSRTQAQGMRPSTVVSL